MKKKRQIRVESYKRSSRLSQSPKIITNNKTKQESRKRLRPIKDHKKPGTMTKYMHLYS